MAPVYIAAALGPRPALLGLCLWYGLTQNGLINLMHECAHGLTFRRKWVTELLGEWLLAPLVLADFQGYRARHWDHHRRLGEADDPKVVYHEDIRRGRLLVFLARCLLFHEGVRRLISQTGGRVEGDASTARRRAWLALARIGFVQACMLTSTLGVAWLTHRQIEDVLWSAALAYGFVYSYGLATLTVFAAALRAIAEHQIGPDEPEVQGRAALRNFRCNFVSRLLMGAYGFGEHATHHREPGIPYYNLPAATVELASEEPALTPRRGYFETLGMLIASRERRSPAR